MSAAGTIEELAFELIEEHTSGDLEKLVKFLDLLINGKKTVEARSNSVTGTEAEPKTTAPATRASASKAKATKASGDDDGEEF